MYSPRFSRAVKLGRGWWDIEGLPSVILDQNFGLGLHDYDVNPPLFLYGAIQRCRHPLAVQSSGKSEVKNEKDKFHVTLHVRDLKPNEIEVKVIGNYIVIHGKHEEILDDFGFIEREFTRRYQLPEGTEAETVKSSLNIDILTIVAPKKAIAEASASNERVVPVSLSSKPSEEETSG